MAERNYMAAPSDLYMACRNGDKAMVERLLPVTSLKTLNHLESNGNTCLHAASSHGHRDIVRLLLARGAGRRVLNRYGHTPLDEARTDEIARLFSRSEEAARQRFADNPTQQPEWQFAQNNAEAFARATHWRCIKDRGMKKTMKKLQKKHILDYDGDPSSELVQNFFNEALETNNPLLFLKAYTIEGQFYKRLNREMATGSPRQVFEKLRRKWTGYYTGVIVGNSAFERYRFSGQTYRGMEITSQEFQRYQPRVALTNKSFQSTSKSWKIARGFACPSNPARGKIPVVIIFNITDERSALSIEDISEYQHEEEVLIVPGTLFIVEHVNTNEIPYEVYLKQLEWKDEF